MWVEEDGASECHLVTRWIGVEPTGNITPRESGQTSIWSFITRELGKTTKGEKQMTASNNLAGASPHTKVNWDAINWRKANQTVRRLQARIVKATQGNRWGKVKALQHLLTRSFSGKALAVKRVTENKGKRTPGIDQIIWNTPEKEAAAVQSLRQKGYRALPLRRVHIPKGSGNGTRPLGIPTMKDRAMQALHLLALDPVAETKGDPNSYGFRSERSTADAIEQCFIALGQENAAEWILKCDIRSCFDRISHDWMLDNIPMEKAILQKWLRAGFIDKHVLHATGEGVPQGGIASPVIANLTLDGLERKLREKYPTKTRRARRAKAHMIRYADDVVFTGSSKELLEEEIIPLINQFMSERGLELSSEKTQIVHVKDGFDFLGQNVRKYSGKILIKPAKKNVKAFLDKVRKVVKANRQATAGHLIVQLNPIIRGWADYHRHAVSSEAFGLVDYAIFKMVWRWAKRRHPKKNRRWVADKYFHRNGESKWVFAGESIDKSGKCREVRLIRAAGVQIKRHTKIKGEANPYDPQWEVYFEERLGAKMVENLRGRRQLLYLWQEQGGNCPVCNQKITKISGWHNHHIIERIHGGRNGAENRVLLHPECHREVHYQKLKVAKPRPTRGV